MEEHRKDWFEDIDGEPSPLLNWIMIAVAVGCWAGVILWWWMG